MPTAIVTGATGILGRQIIRALGQNPSHWTAVHALSRSQKEDTPSNVHHDNIDLTGDASSMAKQLKEVKGEYLFFAAYLQKDTEQENWDVNGGMLHNFLSALDQTGASKELKRVILVTGAKQYGLHLGRPKNPMMESDPWVEGDGRPPNFYYNQQRVLQKHAATVGYDWVVTYPNDVIGFAKNNFMNLCTSVGLYAAVSAELDGTLPWPGADAFYHAATTFTSAKMHANFCLWAAEEPRASNQAFNVVNGDVEVYENLWPKIAARFGAQLPTNMFADAPGRVPSTDTALDGPPPIADTAAALGLAGAPVTRPSHIRGRLDLTQWAQRDEVRQAWTRLAQREGLEKSAFDQATWGFLQFVLGRDFNIVISMSKARAYGYTGYQDTWAALEEAFDELQEAKYLPQAKA